MACVSPQLYCLAWEPRERRCSTAVQVEAVGERYDLIPSPFPFYSKAERRPEGDPVFPPAIPSPSSFPSACCRRWGEGGRITGEICLLLVRVAR